MIVSEWPLVFGCILDLKLKEYLNDLLLNVLAKVKTAVVTLEKEAFCKLVTDVVERLDFNEFD